MQELWMKEEDKEPHELTTSQVANTNLYPHAYSPLIATSKIIAQPSDIARLTLINCTADNENPRICDLRTSSSNTHDKPDSHDHKARQDKRTTDAFTISHIGNSNGDCARGHIDGDGKQLGRGGLVPHLLDDRW